MSIQALYSSISSLEREVIDLEKKIADEQKRENDKEKQIHQVEMYLVNTKSLSNLTLDSKRREIQRHKDDKVNIQKKRTDLLKKLSDKKQALRDVTQKLLKEEGVERKKVIEARKKSEKEQLAFQRQLAQDIERKKWEINTLALQHPQISSITRTEPIMPIKYDYFISHASEDKDAFVRDLASELTQLDLKVWYDESTLKLGDSLRRSIDAGLRNSRFGIVVFSSAFFSKNWPQYELDGLVQREMNGRKVILPIWHKVSKDEVESYSPSLADKVALNTSLFSIKDIAQKLKDFLLEEASS